MTRVLSEQELVRRESLQKLRDLGIDPYPADLFDVNTTSKHDMLLILLMDLK